MLYSNQSETKRIFQRIPSEFFLRNLQEIFFVKFGFTFIIKKTLRSSYMLYSN